MRVLERDRGDEVDGAAEQCFKRLLEAEVRIESVHDIVSELHQEVHVAVDIVEAVRDGGAKDDETPDPVLPTGVGDASIRDVTVTGYEHRIAEVTLPDPDDRHVLAAAIHADAQLIVTKNLRDFPAGALAPWSVEARHPDAFLAELHHDHPDTLGEVVQAMAPAWGSPDATPGQVIDRLVVDAPDAANLIRASLHDDSERP